MELYVCRYVQPSAHYMTDAPFYVPDRVIDVYSGLIWCERYQEPGEFELCMRATPELMRYFLENELLILRKDSDRGMIPERIELTTDAESGNTLKISGRSAESLLNHRTIMQTLTWNENMLSGTAANAVLFYAEKNISNFYYYHGSTEYDDKYRYLPFLDLHSLTLDELTAQFPVKITAQPFGRNLGEFTAETCKAGGFGYRIVQNKDTMRMLMEVYKGADRSLDQTDNAPVIFGQGFAAFGSSVYSVDRRVYYNVGYAAGEGEGRNRVIGMGMRGEFSNQPPFYWKCMGVPRREFFLDAKNISSNSAGIDGNSQKYMALLDSTALAAAEAHKEQTDFSGQVLPGGPYAYRRDYFLGDKVAVQNEYGISGTAIVTEVTETIGEDGCKTIPTLSNWSE